MVIIYCIVLKKLSSGDDVAAHAHPEYDIKTLKIKR